MSIEQAGTGFQLGYALGPFIVAGMIVAAAYGFSEVVRSKRESKKRPWWPLLISVPIALVVLTIGIARADKVFGDENLVIFEETGIASEPFPLAEQFSKDDLANYANNIVDHLKSKEGQENLSFSANSLALDNAGGTVLRTDLMLDEVAISRHYVSVRNGRLQTINCFYESNKALAPADLVACLSRAQDTFGTFETSEKHNG